MPQKIFTKHFGVIEVDRTWAGDNSRHIGKLTKGGYVHMSGTPVTLKGDLEDLIPKGPDLDAALEWWKHKDDPVEKEGLQRIMLSADGGYEWEDGSPIENMADIVNALPQGPQQEAVLTWFHTAQVKKNRQKNIKKVHASNKVIADKKKAEADAKAKAEAEAGEPEQEKAA